MQGQEKLPALLLQVEKLPQKLVPFIITLLMSHSLISWQVGWAMSVLQCSPVLQSSSSAHPTCTATMSSSNISPLTWPFPQTLYRLLHLR